MTNNDKIHLIAQYRWIPILLLATIVGLLLSQPMHLSALMLTLILSAVGLLLAYHKWAWLVLFILSNLPMLVSTSLLIDQKFSPGDTVIFFIIFILSLGLSYFLARKINIIPKIERKYFSIPKILAGFGLIFLVSIATGILAQVMHQTTDTANQEALNQLQKMIPLAVFAAQTLAAGFFEELVYRVGVFEILFKKHKTLAFIVAMLLFALMHSPTDLYSWLTYGLMSLVLTGIYAKYRNFYLSMSTHLLWNLFGLLLALGIR